MNASFDGNPCSFQIDSGHLVLIDPLALDGLSPQLAEVGELPESERPSKLQALGEHGLRIGVQAISGAAPGTYQIDPDAFEAADAGSTDPAVFDIDTGTVIVIDGGALSAVARALTWDRYDALLQAPVDDTSILTEINRDVGGPRFAIVSADASRPFSGDGAFRLKANRLVRVAQTDDRHWRAAIPVIAGSGNPSLPGRVHVKFECLDERRLDNGLGYLSQLPSEVHLNLIDFGRH